MKKVVPMIYLQMDRGVFQFTHLKLIFNKELFYVLL